MKYQFLCRITWWYILHTSQRLKQLCVANTAARGGTAAIDYHSFIGLLYIYRKVDPSGLSPHHLFNYFSKHETDFWSCECCNISPVINWHACMNMCSFICLLADNCSMITETINQISENRKEHLQNINISKIGIKSAIWEKDSFSLETTSSMHWYFPNTTVFAE